MQINKKSSSTEFKNQIIGYEDAIMKSGNLELFDITTSQGNKIYERGLIYLFETCTLRILGKDTKIKIRHPIDKGIYCEIDKKVTEEDAEKIKELMKVKVKQTCWINEEKYTCYFKTKIYINDQLTKKNVKFLQELVDMMCLTDTKVVYPIPQEEKEENKPKKKNNNDEQLSLFDFM